MLNSYRSAVSLAFTLILPVAFLACSTNVQRTQEDSDGITSMERAKVIRVIDGDTVELENGERVRYLGIDTPETVHPEKPVECFGTEATERNKELVEEKTVELLRLCRWHIREWRLGVGRVCPRSLIRRSPTLVPDTSATRTGGQGRQSRTVEYMSKEIVTIGLEQMTCD